MKINKESIQEIDFDKYYGLQNLESSDIKTQIENLLKIKDEINVFKSVAALRVGIANINRRPKPRFYTEKAIFDAFLLSGGKEILFGHRQKETDSYIPLGAIIGWEYNKDYKVGSFFFVINNEEKNIIDKLEMGIINSVSISSNGKGVTTKQYITVTDVTQFNSLDLINRDRAGVLGNYIEAFNLF